MTFILGARCSDGVVLVGDTRFTIDYGIDWIYDYKIFGNYDGILIGFAGIRGTFELFQLNIMNFVKTQEKNKITIEKFILEASDITQKLSVKRGKHYDILLAVSGVIRGEGSSILYYISPDGEIITINGYKAIGTGEPYASFFLKKFWNKEMNMEQTAELGYFIIKYIERFGLNRTVGLDNKPPLDQPTIWLIPDNNVDCRVIDQQYLETIKLKIIKRLDKFEKNLPNIFE